MRYLLGLIILENAWNTRHDFYFYNVIWGPGSFLISADYWAVFDPMPDNSVSSVQCCACVVSSYVTALSCVCVLGHVNFVTGLNCQVPEACLLPDRALARQV